MKRSDTRWAPLFLLCLTLVAASGANAADTLRKFTRIVPKDTKVQAAIAPRNAEGAKLVGAESNWRKDPLVPGWAKGVAEFPGSKPGGVPGNNGRPVPSSVYRPTGSLLTQFQRRLGATDSGTVRNSYTASIGTAPGTNPSGTFGGFMNGQAYPVTDPNLDFNVSMDAVDVNNDGYPDIVNLSVRGNLYVQLNDGKGRFGSPVINTGGQQYNVATKNPPVFVTPADVNGDGLIDLVVTQWGNYNDTKGYPAELLVYLNQGDGKFSDPTAVRPILGNKERPGAVIVTDRDGDGKADIVLVSYQEIDKAFDPIYANIPVSVDTYINVQTLYGNGDGLFHSSENISHYTYAGYSVMVPNGSAQFVTLAGTRYLAFEAGAYAWAWDDFNQMYTYQSHGTSVLLFQDGNGSRSSQPVANAPSKELNIASNYNYAFTQQSGLSLADVNGDGLPDITLSFGDNFLYGALGTSDGGFASPQIIESGVFQFATDGERWLLADVDGDGILDVISQDYMNVGVWLGKGDGTFADPKVFYNNDIDFTGVPGNTPGNLLVAADFDSDGIVDLATTVWSGGTTYILKGHSDGTFAGVPILTGPHGDPPPNGGLVNTVLDLNGDGLSDIVALSGTGSLVTGISDGKGHFAWNAHALPMNENGVDYAGGMAGAGDFNKDGRQDLLIRGFGVNGESIAVALSKGDGTFAYAAPLTTGLAEFPTTTLIGDVDNDGIVDIVNVYCGNSGSPSPGFLVLQGKGDGTFRNQPYITFGQCPGAAVLADVNDDGKLDLVVNDSGNISALLGNGTGTFDTTTQVQIASGFPAYKTVAFDANNDGHIDLAVLNNTMYGAPMSGISVFIGAGDGTFTLSNTVQIGIGDEGRDMVVADFNGDGCADIFVGGQGWLLGPGGFGVFLNLGNCDGTFQNPQSVFLPGAGADRLYLGTFSLDGQPSVVGVSGNAAPNFILYNQTGTKIDLTTSEKPITADNLASFTATVKATWAHRPDPTGTVSFYDHGTLLGTQSLIAGTAQFSTSSLAIGSHAITASYSGDDNFSLQRGVAAVNVKITAPPPVTAPPDIAISSPVRSMVLNRGDSETATLTIVGTSNYTGNVSFTVAGATGGLGVSLSPTTVSIKNGDSATVTVNVTTVAGTTTARVSPLRWVGGTFGGVTIGILIFGLPLRKRRSMWACFLIALCMAGLCLVSTGCGGSGNSHQSNYARSGTSTIVVTATPSVSGASVRTTTFTVTVQ